MGGIEKRWSCMILYRSPASETHSKVPFHKTRERKKGLGKLRKRLGRKEKISSLTFYELQEFWLAILQYDILKMANKDQINKRVRVMTYFTIVMVTFFVIHHIKIT